PPDITMFCEAGRSRSPDSDRDLQRAGDAHDAAPRLTRGAQSLGVMESFHPIPFSASQVISERGRFTGSGFGPARGFRPPPGGLLPEQTEPLPHATASAMGVRASGARIGRPAPPAARFAVRHERSFEPLDFNDDTPERGQPWVPSRLSRGRPAAGIARGGPR